MIVISGFLLYRIKQYGRIMRRMSEESEES